MVGERRTWARVARRPAETEAELAAPRVRRALAALATLGVRPEPPRVQVAVGPADRPVLRELADRAVPAGAAPEAAPGPAAPVARVARVARAGAVAPVVVPPAR